MLPTLRILIALLFYQLIMSEDVEINPGPKLESEPKISELECFRKRDRSGSIHIIEKIADFPHSKCVEFSRKLLNDQTQTITFKDRVSFVFELFRRWLKQPTSQLFSTTTRPPPPRSWKVLAKCLEEFDGVLAREIRENCENVKMPVDHSKSRRRFYTNTCKEKRKFKQQYHQDSFHHSRKRILSPVCGLQNLGNQCYMNATLQCLTHTHMLRECLLKLKPSSAMPSSLQSSHQGLGKQIVTAYTEFQEKMWQEQRKAVTPINLKQTVGHFAPRFAGYGQEDAQEFLTFLLDGLHEGVNQIKEKKYVSMSIENGESWTDKEMADELWSRHLLRNKSEIVELFHSQIKSVLKCLSCTKATRTFEPVIQLTLPIPGNAHVSGREICSSKVDSVTVYDCLNLYVKEKALKWVCEHCRTSTDCVQKYDIWKLPPILIIHLKRFTVTGRECHKVYTNVDYPNKFDLSECQQHLDKANTQYELYAVINHSGMLYAGHYTAYVKEGETWLLCDDEHVSEVSSSQTPNAYVLFYKQT